MSLGTLERTPPPFFNQGPSALSRLVVLGALAVFLMVADARFAVTQPLRGALAAMLYPVQWLAMQPVDAARRAGSYLQTVADAEADEQAAVRRLAQQTLRAAQVELLTSENQRLRQLLALRERVAPAHQMAEVLYDAADPFARRVVIDRGQVHGLWSGAPVLDEFGVLGQVTRVHPLVSEVTLVVDRELSIPVLNTRTGVRSVAYGEPGFEGGGLELRFIAANADVQQGDLLQTSGMDGVYPAGLSVARVARVERRADSAFARIFCTPVAATASARHVMVVQPAAQQLPPRPEPEAAPTRRSARR